MPIQIRGMSGPPLKRTIGSRENLPETKCATKPIIKSQEFIFEMLASGWIFKVDSG